MKLTKEHIDTIIKILQTLALITIASELAFLKVGVTQEDRHWSIENEGPIEVKQYLSDPWR